MLRKIKFQTIDYICGNCWKECSEKDYFLGTLLFDQIAVIIIIYRVQKPVTKSMFS